MRASDLKEGKQISGETSVTQVGPRASKARCIKHEGCVCLEATVQSRDSVGRD